MVEFYKTNKNYYYKKTRNKTKRISKNEFMKSTKKGGMVNIIQSGGNCKDCDNNFDIFTLDPIENFDDTDINNFSFIEDGKCWCFKIYDLYKWIFGTDILIKIKKN